MTPHRGHAGERIRVDLHSHTVFSPDARTEPADLVERAAEVGLARIAVTDHGEIEGALLARELDPERVVVGEEIRCRCRTELIALFLEERIPQGLSLEETVERIRDQDGAVYAPHPFAYAIVPGWHAARALRVADAVEAFNSRAFLPFWNEQAREAARRRGIPAAAGSDAHFPVELGRAYTEMPRFTGAREFLAVLPEARAVGVRLGSPALHLSSAALKASRALGIAALVRRRPAPAEGWSTLPAERA